jgi:aconitase B
VEDMKEIEMERKIWMTTFKFVYHYYYYEISQQIQQNMSSGEYFISDSHLNANIRVVFFTVTDKFNKDEIRKCTIARSYGQVI